MDDKRDIGARLREAAAKQHPELADVVGSYRVDIAGIGSWYMGVDHGRLNVREGSLAADCIIECDENDFWAISEGRQNLLTAVMQGRVKMEGDIALAQKLHGLLPGPVGGPTRAAGVA